MPCKLRVDLGQLAVERGHHFFTVAANAGGFGGLAQFELARLIEHGPHVGRQIDLRGIFGGGKPHRFQFLQPFETVADGAVIGQGAAQPAFADEGHATAGGFAFDGFLGLALGADEKHQTAAAGHLGQVAEGAEQTPHRLTQVDNVNKVALAVDIRPHLGVPTTGTMPEMNTRVDKILYLDNGHALPSFPQADS